MKNLFVVTSLLLLLSVTTLCCAQSSKKNSNENIIEVDEAYFKANIFDYENNPTQFVYKGDTPAIIDFHATWCGPCKALAPKLKRVAEKYGKALVIYKVDIDKNENLAKTFGISSVPTMLFVPLNETPYLSTGNLPEDDIEKMVQKILPQKSDYEKKK